ncbi:hypothetical protein V494_02123 [Pseudogymnoascus sp. VKM F-4513 (FW-928)]|nr:hypothetical protein V494_02123 [Pseudogymnoascus sp. VKM F-4513 (FW-928)]
MPAIRHASKRKAPPAGFSDIEDSLLVFANKMKDAENAPTTAAPKHQALWPIFQVSHQRSRYVWELYKQEKISKQLYDWLCKNGYADAMLIAKWKKDSYSKVTLLLEVHTDQGDELQLDVHMPRAEGESKGGPGGGVRELWVQGVCIWGLSCTFTYCVGRGWLVAFCGYREGREVQRKGVYYGTTHGAAILAGMAFVFAWRWLGILQSFLHQFIGLEYQ